MTAWLLSVAGAGILGVIISFLTNKTRLHSVIKTACTYVFLLILVFPLPALITGGGETSSCGIFDAEVTYDEDILNATDKAYFSIVSASLKRVLAQDGYDVDVSISGNASGDTVVVDGVLVILHGEFSDSSSTSLVVRDLVADYLMTDVSKVRVQIG